MAKAARTATANEDDQRVEAVDHVRAATGAADAVPSLPQPSMFPPLARAKGET
jgi:hypothetical protein